MSWHMTAYATWPTSSRAMIRQNRIRVPPVSVLEAYNLEMCACLLSS